MKSAAPRAPTDKVATPAAGKGVAMVDNRAVAVAQRLMQTAINNSPRQAAQRQQAEVAAPRKNTTGLPDNLKAGVENLSGYSLDDVKVHYNSAKPAQLQAHAYAQGTDIHVAPGQEQHLPHEAWHVVQQKQGRVRPTMQLKGGVNVNVNDNMGLEKEADAMGLKSCESGSKTDKIFDYYNYNTEISVQKKDLKSAISVSSKATRSPVQLIRKKMGLSEDEYRTKLRTTVYLYAEYNGEPLGNNNGIFQTQSGSHAEENLISYIEGRSLTGGTLMVYLSTSPCSSQYGTRDDGKEGCQEKLEKLKNYGITVNVEADHLYQKKDTGESERNSDWPTGFSSVAAAFSSSFNIKVSKLPKSFTGSKCSDDLMNTTTQGAVAQLKN